MNQKSFRMSASAPDGIAPDWGLLLAIALGGALGGSARYGLGRLLNAGADGFPWTTLTANVTGSLLLGMALALIIEHRPARRNLPPFVAVGFLGSYTTFSALGVETILLLRLGRLSGAAAYVGSSLVLGLTAALIGVRLGRRAAAGSR